MWEEYRTVAVAVDGTGPVRAAGGLLTRLHRRALVAVGLAVVAWLFGMLLATTASASPTPPEAESDEPAATTQSQPGLLGGLLGGLTNTLTSTVGGVLDVATTTVGGLTGAVLDTTTSVVAPVLTPPPAPPVVDEPAPAPDRANRPAPAVTIPAAPVVPPAQQEAPVAPSPILVSTVDIRHEPVAQQQFHIVNDVPVPTSDDQANRQGPNRLPSKAPPAPAAPAVPTSTASSAHDGSGQARGTHGVLAGRADLDPPAEARTIRDRAGNAAGRMAGLPANTPD